MINTRTPSYRLVAFTFVAISLVGCNKGSESAQTDSSASGSTSARSSDTTMIRGTVDTVSATKLVIATASGNVATTVSAPYKVYERAPAKLSDVKDNVFIGVTTVKQPDGSERATEIHIFPEELRGLGEGSRMLPQTASGSSANRMTNGAVAQSRMTNGAAAQSRMSNGNVASSNGSTLVVQYAGGSQTVTVPPNTSVTELKEVSKKLAVGDQVVIVATKNADGTTTVTRAMLAGK
ncbi:MAG TPA: hypothetical protein VJ825_02890 [Gemmatimonadaceae bacterium]|nr:hypothetical protein [Gemmatimonadaceae bacterium]